MRSWVYIIWRKTKESYTIYNERLFAQFQEVDEEFWTYCEARHDETDVP